MYKLTILKQVNEILSKAEKNKLFAKIKAINRYDVERTCRDPKLREMVIKDILGKEETQVELVQYSYSNDGMDVALNRGYRVTYFQQMHEYSIIPEYSFPN